jgi:pantoate--beta-alanine ligase
MGALHEGHRALIQAAWRVSDLVAVSIFVNPLQFERPELERYPRTLTQDLRACEKEEVDAVFIPTPRAMYPREFQTRVTVRHLTQRFEGASRPGHFDGVATVVAKLLNIIHPHRTFVGQKDYQQALVIAQMVRDLNIQTEIIVCPTVREPDGLAFSSRNRFLSAEERKAAGVIFDALSAGREAIRRGERSAAKVRHAMDRLIRMERLARLDYAAVADAVTLRESRRVRGAVILLLAVWVGHTRLIDNMKVASH